MIRCFYHKAEAVSFLNEANVIANSSYTVAIFHIYDVLFCLTYCYLSDYTSMHFLFRPKEFALPTKTNRQLCEVARNKDLTSVAEVQPGCKSSLGASGSVQKLAEKLEL
jgi:hypothetical protein